MRIKLKGAAVFAAVLFLLLCITACSSTKSTEKVSEPFRYSGYTEAAFGSYEKSSRYVEMSDGTKVAVDIYLPTEGPQQETFPVIFQYTPYGRAYIVPKANIFEKIAMWFFTGTTGPVLDRANSRDTVYGSSDKMVKLFLSHGYAYVCADMRGTGASYGSKVDFAPILADDGYDLVNWLAEQDWCDGSVGMFGGSYLGYTQLVTASKAPAALKCIVPEVTAFDGYSGEIRPGGIFLWAYSQQDLQILLEYNCYLPDEWSYPTAPVLDEDGDGDLTDEIPIDKNGDGSFLDDYNYPDDPEDVPQYADGNERQHIYYLATREHLKNVPYSELGPKTECIDTVHHYDALTGSAYDVSPAANLDAIMASGIAIYNRGGWMDVFIRGTTELYSTLKDTNPSRMVIDPGYHMGTSPFWKYCGENESKMIDAYGTEYLRFFDRYLKDIENGIDTEDPILIYNMNGDRWRTEKEWPLERQQLTEYHFIENGGLSRERGTDGSDVYRVDLSHSSQWGKEYMGNRWLMETPDTLPIRTEFDELCLTYTSEPVAGDTEVTGHPIVEMWVSSTADTGDFYVYMADVDEKGQAVLVTEGVLNASFAELQDNDDMILGGVKGIDVLPDLPWHGYEEKQKDNTVFAGGKIVKLVMDLMPTSWVFKKGHSIRISIACADWPSFELTPALSPSNDPGDPNNVIPDVTIYRSRKHQSKVILPIIPE